MKHIGAFQAKTHLSQLLAEVVNGESIAITKHGQVVAILVPADNQNINKKNTATEAIKKIRALRKGVTLGPKLSIKTLKEIGRK